MLVFTMFDTVTFLCCDTALNRIIPLLSHAFHLPHKLIAIHTTFGYFGPETNDKDKINRKLASLKQTSMDR
jgi:hypothetical protein